MKTYVTNGTKKEGNAMGKTKAEIIAEYRDLKKENLKLNNQLEHWKAIARKENDRVVDLAKKLDEMKDELFNQTLIVQGKNEEIIKLSNAMEECEKEKSLIKSQRDNLLLEHEKSLQEINEIQNDLEILQSEVRKIQYDEEATYNRAYNEGYLDAAHKYKQVVDSREHEADKLLDECELYFWILKQLHENAIK